MPDNIDNKYDNEQMGFRMSHLSFFEDIAPGNVIAVFVYRWLCQNIDKDNVSLSQLKDLLDIVLRTKKSEQEHSASDDQVHVPIVEQKDICIEQLSIKNFRKFQGDNFTFRLKMYCCSKGSELEEGKKGLDENGFSIGRSLFLIGNNGVGKSSIYDAFEWIMTGGISEGLIRKRDFRKLPYVGAAEPFIKLKLTDGQEFESYTEFEKKFRGNRMLALFCSERDIFHLGQELSTDDYTMFFARLMGYGDVVDLYDFLVKYNKDVNKEYSSSNAKQIDDLKEELSRAESEQDRILRELLSTLWTSLSDIRRRKEFVILRKMPERIEGILNIVKNDVKERYDKFSAEMKALDEQMNLYKELNGSPAKNEDENIEDNIDKIKLDDESIIKNENQRFLIILESYDRLKAAAVPQNVISGGSITVSHDNKINWTKIEQALGVFRTTVNNSLLLGAEGATQEYLKYRSDVENKRKEIVDSEFARIINENNDDIKDYIKLIDEKLHKLIKDKCDPYIKLITHIMEDFKMEGEDFNLSIKYDKENMLRIRLKNENNNDMSAARFYNSFRYKLFCLLLKLVGGLAYMKLDKVRIPIILDDVFYGSDFYSRTKVKKFFVMLLDGIKKQLKNEDGIEGNIQIICLTHDEIVFNAVVDAVAETRYKLVSFGRIIDSYRTVLEARNPKHEVKKDEGDIYVKFFNYE